MTILTAAPDDPTGYGQHPAQIAEFPRGRSHRRAEGADRRSSKASPRSTPAFTPSRPRRCSAISASSPPTTPTAELILTDMAGLLRAAGERVVAIQAARCRRSAGRQHHRRTGRAGRDAARRDGQPADGRGRDHLPAGDLRDRRRCGSCGRYGDRAVCAVAGAHEDRRRLPDPVLLGD